MTDKKSVQFKQSKYIEVIENDSYSPTIIQELLRGTSEWGNTQDIVKLTFKAIHDMLKVHGEALKDFERLMITKSSKAELNAGLSQKANVEDVSQTIADIASSLKLRPSIEDISSLLDRKVGREDLEIVMNNKVDYQELKLIMGKNVSSEEYNREIKRIYDNIDFLKKDQEYKWASIANIKDLQEIKLELDKKANAVEIAEEMQKKATKESVANALKRKANELDVSSSLANKLDTTEFQKIIMGIEDKMNHIMEFNKNQRVHLESIESIKKEFEENIKTMDIPPSSKALQDSERLNDLEIRLQNLDINIEEIKKILTNKADEEDIENISQAVNKKMNKDVLVEEMDGMKMELEKQILENNKKLDLLSNKYEEILSDTSKIKSKYELTEFEVKKQGEEQQTQVEEFRREIEKIKKINESCGIKFKNDMQAELEQLSKSLIIFSKDLKEIETDKPDRKELADMQAFLKELIDSKIDTVDLQRKIADANTEIILKLTDARNDFGKEIATLNNLMTTQLELKANASEVESILRSRAEQNEAINELHQKVNYTDVLSMKQQIVDLKSEIDQKIDRENKKIILGILKERDEELMKELASKANVKDVCTLVDAKANIEDINKALAELHQEIDKKANNESLTHALSDQALINEVLCAENCVARWLWKSGEVKNGYAVPWETQTINSCPDNFLWEKDRISVVTVTPGLYEITMGFFTKKKPIVQVLVNGEPILSAVNSSR